MTRKKYTSKFKTKVVLEALEELMYKYSLKLSTLKGGPMNKERKSLSEKQEQIEELQHAISQQT